MGSPRLRASRRSDARATAIPTLGPGARALFGIVVGAIFSVLEHLGFRAFFGWSSVGIVAYLLGRLIALAFFFAAIALMRNVIARSLRRKSKL